ncbi:MAG TPA: acetate kinase [Methylomirabilota bacterium]|jgi:acetate kinase|nr:acetate kinase [Methylomirabilota bacterium]
MIVLVLNCGSSSVKFQVIASQHAQRSTRLGGGKIERIGEHSTLTFQAEGQPEHRSGEPIADHEAAVHRVIEWATGSGLPRVEAVGHRVVHGGEGFTGPAVVVDDVIAAIEALEPLAPLHNAPALAGIRASRALLGPGVPMVAVFDTAFHTTLPERAARYAIPYEMSLRHRIRRYGFHGIAYRSVLDRYGQVTGTPPSQARIIVLHLGNGASVAAIERGRSIDTSMGFTPLEGLVMGTRAGDLDPALVPYLAAQEEMSAAEVVARLNQHSGLLGVSGVSGDMRDLLEREGEDPRARLAVDMFCYRARKYLGAYLAVLGRPDAIVFSGGIGERAPAVRARICAGLEWFGLALDHERNERTVGEVGRISGVGTRVSVWVIPADEELVIAEDALACLTAAGPSARSMA